MKKYGQRDNGYNPPKKAQKEITLLENKMDNFRELIIEKERIIVYLTVKEKHMLNQSF